MIGRPKRSSTIKYSILKPNAEINSLRRCFTRPHPRCGYELAQDSDASVRRYKKNIESLQQTLQDCQWRHEEKAPIVHCLYVELLAPSLTSKSISVEIYVEDLEVSLAKMRKILLPQAIYLITQAIVGFKVLWERFKYVSIDEETFGLDCKGNCLAWINSSLEKNHCEDFKLETPHDIVREIILQVKSKSQPVCEALLSKLLDSLMRREFDFYESQHIISVFAKNHQVKVPENLKYLVHQDRLNKKLEGFRTKRSICQSRQQLNTLKTPRFVPSRASLREEVCRTPKTQSKEGSMCNLMSTLRMTVGPDVRFLTCRSINQNKQVDSSMREDDISLTQFETRRKFNDSGADKDHSYSSHHSRCKSQSYQHIKDCKGPNIRPKKETETTRSIDQVKATKRYSGVSGHIKAGGSYIDKFKKSDHSLAELQTAKKLIHKSSNEMESGKYLGSVTPCEEFDFCQGNAFVFREDEPTKQKIPINIISPLQSSDPTFHVIPQPDQVIRANQWTTTLRNLLQTESKMNTSITEGQDTCSYLDDVRLDRLDTISRQMVVSLIPQGSEKLIGSDELIS